MSILRKVSALAGAVIISTVVLAGTASAQTTPTVTITPGGPYVDSNGQGQQVTVSVGPNSVFPAGQSVKILECSAGATSDSQCDGNTINVDPVITAADGSFTYTKYVMYLLPDSLLGENASQIPKCNANNACELYVGLNQNDFTQPKLFSSSFNVLPNSPIIPETTYLPFLPIGALLILGGAYVVLRRRNRPAQAA